MKNNQIICGSCNNHVSRAGVLFSLLISYTILTGTVVIGQILLPNYGFEIGNTDCAKDKDGQLYINKSPVEGWWGTALSTLPSGGGTPDFFHPCAPNGANNCGEGSGAVGFFTVNWLENGTDEPRAREFIQARLLSPLEADVEYSLEIQAMPLPERPGNNPLTWVNTDGLGIYFFSQGPFREDTMLTTFPGNHVKPQIENMSGNIIDRCMTVSGSYVAQGGEEWVLIGNFRDIKTLGISPPCPSSNICQSYLIIDFVRLEKSISSSVSKPLVHRGRSVRVDNYSGIILVDFDKNDTAPVLMTIVDVTGKTVLTKIITENQSSVSAEKLIPGIYLFSLQEDGQITQRGKLFIH